MEPARAIAQPLFAFFDPVTAWNQRLHALLSVIWIIVVWGIAGGAIARITIVQAAKARQTGVGEAIRFALRAAAPLITAPCCPLLGLAFCAALCATFGLLYRVPIVGPAISGVLFFLPLAAGFVMTLLVAGQVASWPLMHAAIASGA